MLSIKPRGMVWHATSRVGHILMGKFIAVFGRYSIAFIVVGLVILVKAGIGYKVAPFVLNGAAVMVAAWFGLGPAILAISLLTMYALVAGDRTSNVWLTATGISFIEQVLIIIVCVRWRKAHRDLQNEIEYRKRLAEQLSQNVERLNEADAVARVALSREVATREMAERANRLKDDFLATLSHELRTPLTAIIGWIKMLQDKKHPPKDSEKGLEVIYRNAMAQKQLIEDLLDVSRIIEGKIRLLFRPLRLSSIVRAALDAVAPTAHVKNITITFQIENEDRLVSGDFERLQQVVWNLLSNAVKFTNKNGAVAIKIAQDEDQVCLTIADNGRGISEKFLPFVFERFQQQEEYTRRTTTGLGLGLAIVRHLVEMHGGGVSVQSEGEQRGATFKIYLPLLPANTVLSEAGSTAPASGDSSDKLSGVKVLVVEDDKDAREMIEEMLQGYGANVTAVPNAADAVNAYTSKQHDIIVSDIGLPIENGYELIQRIRLMENKHGIHIPAIALTAFAKPDDRNRAIAAGFDDHIPKPIEPKMLSDVIAQKVRH